MQKKVVVFLADGFEEVEAITPIDYLRRAGIEVTTVSVGPNPAVKGSHGILIMSDSTLLEMGRPRSWDAVLLPGGMPGAANIAASEGAANVLRESAQAGKLICAICASPAVVLAPLGLLAGRRFTCYPGMEERVSGAFWSEERVVVDGNVITSRAAGTAGAWAQAIIARLTGEAAAGKLAASVLLQPEPERSA
jgi:4-methyl-5(b-hydroxyethyl)-thiazole monophosphate biosynthesis